MSILKLSRLVVILITLSIEILKSQVNNLPSLQYIPQSPTAAAYSRYGEIPVDFSTGVPNIEIPIYTLEVGDVKVPVTISYHASGIKVKDLASEVGLGWVLNYGGSLTVNILGIPDVINRKPFGYRTSTDINNSISNCSDLEDCYDLLHDYWYDLSKKYPVIDQYWLGLSNPPNLIDFFSDRFNYRLCTGESGIFRKDFIQDNLIRYIPYQPIEVIRFEQTNIDIVSTNGFRHYFKNYFSNNRDIYFLDKIVAADKTDSILYFYTTCVTDMDEIAYSVSWKFEEVTMDGGYIHTVPQESSYINKQFVGEAGGRYNLVLDSIISKNVIICFNYTSDRHEDESTGKRMIKATIKNRQTRQSIKVFNFVHSYFGTSVEDNERLRLDGINVSGSTAEIVDKYSFYYNNTPLPKYPKMEPGNNFYEDYWGYYNGSGATNLIPPFFSTFAIPSFHPWEVGYLQPDATLVKACILTEIKYPTGGKTKFEYEANCVDGNIGGLRIKKITSYTDESSPAFTKTYAYSRPIYREIVPTNYRFSSPQEHYVVDHNNIGYTTYYTYSANSNSYRPILNSNGTPVMFQEVTEFLGENTAIIGKNVYNYDCYKWEESQIICNNDLEPRFLNRFHNDYGNYQPKSLGMTSYKFSDGIFIPVREVSNLYSEYKTNEFNTGLVFASDVDIETIDGTDPENAFRHYNTDRLTYEVLTNRYAGRLIYCDTKGYEDKTVLISTSTIDYTENGSVVSTTYYEYDDYTQVNRKTGPILDTYFNYPYDLSASGNIYEAMVNKHILTPVVEQIDYNGTTHLQTTKTNYSNWSNNIIAPITIQTKQGSNPNFETHINYQAYDNHGNVISVSQENDIPTGYYWDYNKTYPVIKAANVTGNQLALTIEYYENIFPTGVESFDQITEPSLNPTQNTWLKEIHANLCADFPNGMISVYTYKPLVGMTSETGPDGVTTYYEYDSFGRLQYIKDQDLNIIQEYKYHYKE
ncbi:MAG: hypothetical protein JXB00_15705 [Bacteroidales bacterium]|nr:hypothetical protein [Bacteroidales bacterium]